MVEMESPVHVHCDKERDAMFLVVYAIYSGFRQNLYISWKKGNTSACLRSKKWNKEKRSQDSSALTEKERCVAE